MKWVALAAPLILVALVSDASAQGYQFNNGYTRRDGTYVQPHYSTRPDGNPYNNWSTRGNTNPFTGQQGYRNPQPYPTPRPPSYGQSNRRAW